MRRLLPTTVGVLAVVAVIAVATVIGELSEDTPSTTTPTPTIEYSQEPPPPQTHTDDPTPADSTTTPGDHDRQQQEDPKSDKDQPDKKDEPPEWRRVIDGFAADFTKPGKHEPVKKWHKDLARWTTPALADAYKSTDPRNLPTTLADITIESQGHEAVTAIIRYRGLPPTWVVVQPTGDGWRITQVEPYRQHGG